MTFVQLEFLYFFLIVYTVYWMLRSRRAQNALLLVSSAIFYGWVHPWFLILMYGAALMDYLAGLAMGRWPEHRKLLLAGSMCLNLGLLGYYKYFDFFIVNVDAALSALGMSPGLTPLGIFLPVGISFYTFQTMSYTIDVYRGELAPRKDLLDYMVFVSLFPQLVAGPVERATNLLKQVEQDRTFRAPDLVSGLTLAMWGAVKKVCVADQISPFVDKMFIVNNPSGPMIWAASVGFAVQILADFSGYTDIARGTARMLGFELMLNFDSPYLSRNPSQFWRRWHISFSSWIRDYLYIPMGGSRGGFWAATRATFGSMLLSGLWHGASWNFVIWGGYHAALLTGYRLVTPRIPRAVRDSRLGDAAAVVLMFGFTCVGWLLFRETHLDRLVHAFTQNPLGGTRDQWVAAAVMLALSAVYALPMVLASVFIHRAPRSWSQSPWSLPLQTTGWAAAALAIGVLARDLGGDFIYFQF